VLGLGLGLVLVIGLGIGIGIVLGVPVVALRVSAVVEIARARGGSYLLRVRGRVRLS